VDSSTFVSEAEHFAHAYAAEMRSEVDEGTDVRTRSNGTSDAISFYSHLFRIGVFDVYDEWVDVSVRVEIGFSDEHGRCVDLNKSLLFLVDKKANGFEDYFRPGFDDTFVGLNAPRWLVFKLKKSKTKNLFVKQLERWRVGPKACSTYHVCIELGRYEGLIWNDDLAGDMLQQGRQAEIELVLVDEDDGALAEAREAAPDWRFNTAVDLNDQVALDVAELNGDDSDEDVFDGMRVNDTLWKFSLAVSKRERGGRLEQTIRNSLQPDRS
jgi:hypothetical protein